MNRSKYGGKKKDLVSRAGTDPAEDEQKMICYVSLQALAGDVYTAHVSASNTRPSLLAPEVDRR